MYGNYFKSHVSMKYKISLANALIPTNLTFYFEIILKEILLLYAFNLLVTT